MVPEGALRLSGRRTWSREERANTDGCLGVLGTSKEASVADVNVEGLLKVITE